MAYVEVDGVRVHYVEHGAAGPGVATVVLVHGFPVDQRLMVGAFEPVFADRPGWRRVYVDLPGMGGTVAPDVASTDDVFRILRGAVQALVPEGPYVLVGQSYGGYLARGLTAADAGRVAGLAVVVTVVEPRHDLRELPPCQVLVQDPALIERVGSEALAAEEVLVVQTEETWARSRQEVDPGLAAADPEAVARVEAHYAGSFPVEPAPVGSRRSSSSGGRTRSPAIATRGGSSSTTRGRPSPCWTARGTRCTSNGVACSRRSSASGSKDRVEEAGPV